MDYNTEKSILDAIQRCWQDKNWQHFLSDFHAEEAIPLECKESPKLLNRLAAVYMQAARQEADHGRYTLLALEAYNLSMKLEENIKTYQGLAYLYYNEFLRYTTSRKGKKSTVLIPLQDCERNALYLYSKIAADNPDVYDLYRYAHLLYSVSSMASVSSNKRPFAEIIEQKENAYHIYIHAALRYEELTDKDKERLHRVYIKICYGICRCGLSLIANRSALLNELVLLFSFKARNYGDNQTSLERFKEIGKYMKKLIKAEGLDTDTKDLLTVANSEQLVAKSWDVYYLMGKYYDYAIQYELFPDIETAYKKAEQYYSYACEIDTLRRSKGKSSSGFKHMYWALLKLYLRWRKEERFCAVWEKYNKTVGFEDEYRTVFQARWLILNEEYKKAKALLLQSREQKKGKGELSGRKINLLLDIVRVISGEGPAVLEGNYRPYQQRYLYELAESRNI